jgi:hypothetical protein
MNKYEHTQIGYLMIFVFGLAVICLAIFMALTAFNIVALFVLILLLLCMPLFATLTVTIDENYIKLKFGIGIIHKKISLENIDLARKVRNSWYHGWGIHGFPGKGWVFNVSGFDAVELQMSDGIVYRIGTDEPDKLLAAVKAAMEMENQND